MNENNNFESEKNEEFVVCRNCGENFKKSFVVCPKCGEVYREQVKPAPITAPTTPPQKPLPPQPSSEEQNFIYCNQCGKHTSKKFSFCQNCGAPITVNGKKAKGTPQKKKNTKIAKRFVVIGSALVAVVLAVTIILSSITTPKKSENNKTVIYFTQVLKTIIPCN